MKPQHHPYIDSETGVYRNKFGATDPETLRQKEYIATSNRARELRERPINGTFDFEHLKSIHKHLLQDVYEWAGKPRSINFSKRDALEPSLSTRFSPAEDIKGISDYIAQNLRDKNYLQGLPKDKFVGELTNVYQQLNYLHPFPEGNGRATQEFMQQLARNAGYNIDYRSVGKIVWNVAAARTQIQVDRETGEKRQPDLSLMRSVFDKIVSPLEKDRGVLRDSPAVRKDQARDDDLAR